MTTEEINDQLFELDHKERVAMEAGDVVLATSICKQKCDLLDKKLELSKNGK